MESELTGAPKQTSNPDNVALDKDENSDESG